MPTESGVSFPRGQALWRLNELGLLQLRAEPGHPIYKQDAWLALQSAIERGLWVPRAHTSKHVDPAEIRRFQEFMTGQVAGGNGDNEGST